MLGFKSKLVNSHVKTCVYRGLKSLEIKQEKMRQFFVEDRKLRKTHLSKIKPHSSEKSSQTKTLLDTRSSEIAKAVTNFVAPIGLT